MKVFSKVYCDRVYFLCAERFETGSGFDPPPQRHPLPCWVVSAPPPGGVKIPVSVIIIMFQSVVIKCGTRRLIKMHFITYNPGGGGGRVTRHMTGYASVSPPPQKKKKVSKVCVFQTSASSTFFLKMGCIFIFYRTLGVPRNKNIRSIYSEFHLGYHKKHHDD